MSRTVSTLRAGFTLVEMVVVIVITGVIVASVAVFIRQPVQGYVDATRRAEMSDIADTALRRMARDLKLALPNSVRLTDGDQTLELLMTRTGGRYRTTGVGFLDFTQMASSLSQLGPFASGVGQSIIAGDRVVIYNLGIGEAEAYASDNSAVITSVDNTVPNEPIINFSSKRFPFESPDARFQIVEGPVSYACNTNAGQMNLTRYSGYPITLGQPAAATLATTAPVKALLASNVSACVFSYTEGVTARSGVVALTLRITVAGESVQLYQEAHVSNVP